MTEQRSIQRAAAGMSIATGISRIIGFARVLAIVAILGTTYLGNAFQSSNLVSNVLFELVAAGALSAVLVPTFVRHFDENATEHVERLAGGLLTIAIVGLGLLSVVGVLAAPLLARLLTVGVKNSVIAGQQRSLTTFLLRFFIPQIVMYGAGTIAIAVLNARRRFALCAAAPIASTVAMIICLGFFRLSAGSSPTIGSLTSSQRLLLAAAGTLGVAAYVGIPLFAVWATGFRFQWHFPERGSDTWRLIRLSWWGTLMHIGGGVLLGAALIIGNSVAGGSVAYYSAYVFFLAPYAILAQPIHTAVLPELSMLADNTEEFVKSVRWSSYRVLFFTAPVAALGAALALPAMRIVTFGQGDSGVGLLAAALATLLLGLPFYSIFFLFSRISFALHDSRTPALSAMSGALVGIVVMFIGATHFHGTARIAVLGAAYSIAFGVAACSLGWILSTRLKYSVIPLKVIPLTFSAIILGVVAWVIEQAVSPQGRISSAALVVAVTCLGTSAYFLFHYVRGDRIIERAEEHAL